MSLSYADYCEKIGKTKTTMTVVYFFDWLGMKRRYQTKSLLDDHDAFRPKPIDRSDYSSCKSIAKLAAALQTDLQASSLPNLVHFLQTAKQANAELHTNANGVCD